MAATVHKCGKRTGQQRTCAQGQRYDPVVDHPLCSGCPFRIFSSRAASWGISTVFLRLDDGPNGVFLTVDDEETPLAMDQAMELVLRRIYAQEGFIRYGLKARAILG